MRHPFSVTSQRGCVHSMDSEATRQRIWSAAVLLVLVQLFAGCATISQINFISTQEEVALGRQFAEQVETEMKMYDDPVVQAYVDSLGQLLAAHSDRTNIEYHIKVVDTDEVNAFALPGGYLYVNRGLISTAETESELAAVMGHEIGHIVGKHSARQLSGQIGLSSIIAIALGDSSSMVEQLVAGIVTTGALMKYSRDMESEADVFGADETYRAGIDPGGMAAFFGKLLELEGGRTPSGLEKFFSTHPPTRERIDKSNAYIAQLPFKAGLRKDSKRFQQIKKRLPPLGSGK